MDAAKAAVAGAGVAAHRFLDFAEGVDAKLQGKRAVAIIGISGALLVAEQLKFHSFVKFGAWMLILGVGLVAAARVAACRDDEGEWTWDLVVAQVAAYFDDLTSFVTDLAGASFDAAAYRIGRVVFGVGVFMMATTVVSRAVHAKWISIGGHGFAIALVGLALFAYGWWRLRGMQLALKSGAKSLTQVVPSVVDASTLREAERRATDDPLASRLFEALSTWNVKEYYYEEQYEHALVRHIKKKAPELLPKTQLRHQSESGLCRFDIVVGDSVVIELKKRMNQGQTQTGTNARSRKTIARHDPTPRSSNRKTCPSRFNPRRFTSATARWTSCINFGWRGLAWIS